MTPKLIAKSSGDDERQAVLQEFLDYQYEKYQGVIESLSVLNPYLKAVYGIENAIPQNMLDKALEEIIRVETGGVK